MDDKEFKKIKEAKIKKMLDQTKAGVVKLTSSTFDNFLNTDLPVLVDFWADWCMPCRMMSPVMEELANAYAGKALFGKVNVDEDSQIAGRYGIMSLLRPFTIKRNEQTCVNCGKCDKACPMQINVSKAGKLRTPQCVNCFECMSTCPVDGAMEYGFVFKRASGE